jgi:hypothetical protein
MRVQPQVEGHPPPLAGSGPAAFPPPHATVPWVYLTPGASQLIHRLPRRDEFGKCQLPHAPQAREGVSLLDRGRPPYHHFVPLDEPAQDSSGLPLDA